MRCHINTRKQPCAVYECSNPLTEKIPCAVYECSNPLTEKIRMADRIRNANGVCVGVCVYVCVWTRHYVCASSVYERSLQESAQALNGLNTNRNKKETQFINFSEDTTMPRLCKWQSLCQLCSIQIAYRQTWCVVIWRHFKRERERARARWSIQCCLWHYVSQKLFKLRYKLYNE